MKWKNDIMVRNEDFDEIQIVSCPWSGCKVSTFSRTTCLLLNLTTLYCCIWNTGRWLCGNDTMLIEPNRLPTKGIGPYIEGSPLCVDYCCVASVVFILIRNEATVHTMFGISVFVWLFHLHLYRVCFVFQSNFEFLMLRARTLPERVTIY